MTDKELIDYIKVHNKFPRTFYDYLNYSIFMLPLFFIVMGLTIINYGKQPFELLVGILVFLFAIFVSILMYKKLTGSRIFHLVPQRPDLTLDEAHEIIKSNFKLLHSTVNYEICKIEAHEPMTFFSYGSEITIIIDGQVLLINVRVGPFFQPFTFFRDKKNLQKLTELLT